MLPFALAYLAEYGEYGFSMYWYDFPLDFIVPSALNCVNPSLSVS